MATRNRIPAALATAALAGITVLISGAATPAHARTEAIAPQHPTVVQSCDWDDCYGWDEEYIDGWRTDIWDSWTWSRW